LSGREPLLLLATGDVELPDRFFDRARGVGRLDMADHGGRRAFDAHDRLGGKLRLLGHVTAPLADPADEIAAAVQLVRVAAYRGAESSAVCSSVKLQEFLLSTFAPTHRPFLLEHSGHKRATCSSSRCLSYSGFIRSRDAALQLGAAGTKSTRERRIPAQTQ